MRLKNILACAALAWALGSGVAAPAIAEDMKFANFMAATHPYVAGTFEPFAKAVEDGTKGAVVGVFEVGGELGADLTPASFVDARARQVAMHERKPIRHD